MSMFEEDQFAQYLLPGSNAKQGHELDSNWFLATDLFAAFSGSAMLRKGRGEYRSNMRELRAASTPKLPASMRAASLAKSTFRGRMLRGFGYAGLMVWIADTARQVTRPGVTSIQRNDQKKLDAQFFQDSARAYEQRMRAIAAIHDSQMRLRPLLGSESAYLHR